MRIKPSTKDSPATIELSEEDEARIAKIGPDFFLSAPDFPEGIRSARSVKTCPVDIHTPDEDNR